MTSSFEPNGTQLTGPGRRRRQKRQAGSWAVRNNFARMEREFGTGARGSGARGGGAPGGGALGGGAPGTGSAGTALLTHPGGTSLPPVSDAKPLVEVDVLGKVGILTLIAIGVGGVSFLLPVSIGFALVCVFVAFGLGLWTTFRPRMARVLAPLYAAIEGLALGVLSRLYNAQSHGIVPLAIVLTGSIFIGVLIAYRTRLVRVTNRFISMTFVAGFALLAAMLAVIFGLSVPGVGRSATGLLIFGVVYVIVAILDLFVDFELVNRAAKAGVPAEAEWYAAFSIFVAVVMLYLGLLRILAGRR